MYCVIKGHGFINDAQSISQIFYPNENFIITDTPSGNGVTVVSRLNACACALVYKDGVLISSASSPVTDGGARMAVAYSIFGACRKVTGIDPPWGLLVGIRPTKIVHEMRRKGYSADYILNHLKGFYKVSDDKARLCANTANAAAPFLSNNNNSVSLYIGVPFCVSRCLYCSFSSYIISRYKKSAASYINALIKELDAIALYLNKTGKTLQTIYIGGGTPTSLDACLFELLLKAVAHRFGLCNEFTVEAGRPDTIDPVKLEIMKSCGVSRISVNPQTLNDKTLKLIGRYHTAEDFYRAYELSRQFGFIINTDLIMGLPLETSADMIYTLNGVMALKPDNITIHTLTVKRASALKEQLNETALTGAFDIEQILLLSAKTAARMGLYPYYMYRQKNTLGNFENVSYCKRGLECIYNIQMTEERQTILGVGAGAVTKHFCAKRNLIRRLYNVKPPEEYLKRIDEMIERKKKLYEYDES